jgi:hypothetical protein
MSNKGFDYYIVEGGHDQDPDPEQAGRVRLRKMGAHGAGVQTSHLPFSQLASPTSGTGHNEFNRPPPPGTIVLGHDAGDQVGYAFAFGIPHGIHEEGASIPGNAVLPFLPAAKKMAAKYVSIPTDMENKNFDNRTGIQKFTTELKEKQQDFMQALTNGVPGHGATFALSGIRNTPLQKITTALDQAGTAMDPSKLAGLGQSFDLGSLMGGMDLGGLGLPSGLQGGLSNAMNLLPQMKGGASPEWGSMLGNMVDPSSALSAITSKLSGVTSNGGLQDALKDMQSNDFISSLASQAQNVISSPTAFGNISQTITGAGQSIPDMGGIGDILKSFISMLSGILQGGPGKTLFSQQGTQLPEMLGRMKDVAKQENMSQFLEQLSNKNKAKQNGRVKGTAGGNDQVSRAVVIERAQAVYADLGLDVKFKPSDTGVA